MGRLDEVKRAIRTLVEDEVQAARDLAADAAAAVGEAVRGTRKAGRRRRRNKIVGDLAKNPLKGGRSGAKARR